MRIYVRTLVVVYTMLSIALCMSLILTKDAGAEMATYYADGYAGSPTASGVPYDPGAYTAAHPGYAMGTPLDVCRVDGGGCVQVVVNDTCACSLDLSRIAMADLGGIEQGVVPVTATPL